ncbi:MAG: PepSY domain-containing protein [Parabacteroides sp.]
MVSSIDILTKLMLWIHKVLGILLSALFCVWFLSGLVMVYHTFPRVSQADRIARMDGLEPGVWPSVEELTARLPEGDTIRSLSLDGYLGEPMFHIRTNSGSYDLPADSATVIPTLNAARFQQIAARWCDAPVQRIDTLHQLDQWIPFGQLKRELPIYRYHFADAERHQLYLSSRTGKVLQWTDADSRFWAWLGAIPHWIYFTSLRQDADRWIRVVVWLSGLGSLMCLAGLYLGIRDFRLARRRGNQFSPFKRFWFKWHHIIGTLFGLFVLTFVFSGMMSLARVQDWGIRAKLPFSPQARLRQLAPLPADYPLDYRVVIAAYPGEIRQLEWSCFGLHPFYTLQTGEEEGTRWIDASQSTPSSLYLTDTQVLEMLRQVHGADTEMEISSLDHYDSYYISKKRNLPLPVWKVTLDDVDRSTYYIHPESGRCQYVNTPSRWHHWMYPAFHSLNFRLLVNHPLWWEIVMWCLMLGGTFVSLSGLCLAVHYLIRWVKRPRHL